MFLTISKAHFLNDNINNVIDSLIEISNSISIGDNIETSIYTDQNWYLQNIHGFFTCINTSYYINKKNIIIYHLMILNFVLI